MTDRDLDVITIGSVMAEISPPEHSVRVTEAESLVMVQAGSATTFAIAFSRLGGRLGLISRTGDDEIGRWMRNTLAAEGVDTSEVRVVANQLTPVSLASVDGDGRKSFAYYRFPGYSEPLGMLRSEDLSDGYLARARIFELTESSLRSRESRSVAMEVAHRARALGCEIAINPNYRPTAWTGGRSEARTVLREALAIAGVAIMNAEEAMLITGASSAAAAARHFRDNGPGISVITRGAQPSLLVTGDGIAEVPVVKASVVFDIGAGDTFHAGFLVRYAEGASLSECARFAAHAAALKIQRPPLIDRLPTRAEVEHHMTIGVSA